MLGKLSTIVNLLFSALIIFNWFNSNKLIYVILLLLQYISINVVGKLSSVSKLLWDIFNISRAFTLLKSIKNNPIQFSTFLIWIGIFLPLKLVIGQNLYSVLKNFLIN